jgi:hypothetical protein
LDKNPSVSFDNALNHLTGLKVENTYGFVESRVTHGSTGRRNLEGAADELDHHNLVTRYQAGGPCILERDGLARINSAPHFPARVKVVDFRTIAVAQFSICNGNPVAGGNDFGGDQ